MIDKVLYCFENDKFVLFEVKFILDTIDKSKLYNWLLFDKSSQFFTKLDFISMSDGERIFKQGKLNFDNKSAKIIIYNTEIKLDISILNDEILNLLNKKN